MNANDPFDALLLDYQFALWREALALANMEKAARRRFAKRLNEAGNRQRALLKALRSTGASKRVEQRTPDFQRSGTSRKKIGDQLLQSRFLSLFRHNPPQGSGGLVTALAAKSSG